MMRRNPPPGWRPSGLDAELFIDMIVARLPLALIAERFGIDVATLREYLARLYAADHAPITVIKSDPNYLL
jgi:hypothetical protein